MHRGDTGPKSGSGTPKYVDYQLRVDDSRLAQTADHFRANLREICRAGSAAGAPVVVCTIPVNLKDSAPFGSLHAAGLSAERIASWDAHYVEGTRFESEKKYNEALECYRNAAQIDDQYADLEFRQARILAALGKVEEARTKFARARDLDTLRFRSSTTINRIIREVVDEGAPEGVYLADAERTFAEASPNRIPGEEFFLEHVHMNFSGNYLMARTIFQTIAPVLDSRLPGKTQVETLSEQACAERLAYTDWNALNVMSDIQFDLQFAPFTNQLDRDERKQRWEGTVRTLRTRLDRQALVKAVNVHRAAAESAEGDFLIRHNCARILMELEDHDGAEEQFRAALHICRHHAPTHCSLGQLLIATGRAKSAEEQFREALRSAPDLLDARLGLADALGAQGRVDEGLAIYEEQLAKATNRTGMLNRTGMYLVKMERFEDARPRLMEALQLNPDDLMAHGLMGDIAFAQGHREEAIVHYEAALRQRPDLSALRKRIAAIKSETNPKK